MKKISQKGFTLIELMIVIGIIGILSTIGIGSFSQIQKNGRDAKRKADLKSMQVAVEAFYAENGMYPSTGLSWRGNCSSYSSKGFSGPDGYIPGLAPKYIANLPKDPRQGTTGAGAASTHACYLYRSDGSSYKILAHTTPEGAMDKPDDPFYDPVRRTWAWQVSSDTTARDTW